MAAKEGFQNFETIFGEIKSDFVNHNQEKPRPFLFYVHALDHSRLQIVASDFHSNTFAQILTVDQLDDLRDDIGIGGSWSEFVDYFILSFSSEMIKFSIEGNITGESKAKLIAHKAKGLPRISIPLNKLMKSLASDAMSNFSMAMFKAFKEKHNKSIKEHEHLVQVNGLLSSEREKSERLQKELDSLSFLSKRKVHKSKASEAALVASSSAVDNNSILTSEIPPSTTVSQTQPPLANNGNVEETAVKDTQPTKVSQRAAPVSRRAKTRGVSLRDSEDDEH